MSVDELAKIVRQMYDDPAGSRKTRMNQAQKPIMANLFGILFAREIEACGEAPTMTARVIARKAGIGAADGRSYGKEIDRGRLLAEYVSVHDGSILKWRA
jgi:hypothetical protein